MNPGPSESKVTALNHHLTQLSVLERERKELCFKTRPKLCLYNFQTPDLKGNIINALELGPYNARQPVNAMELKHSNTDKEMMLSYYWERIPDALKATKKPSAIFKWANLSFKIKFKKNLLLEVFLGNFFPLGISEYNFI